MSSTFILVIIAAYFLLLVVIAHFTGKKADSKSFYLGNKSSKWYLVAFGMIGASLSGVTFISVPGWVQQSGFTYMQVVLGYLVGYLIISFVLMPLYYRLNLTSIYAYLGSRFGKSAYKTGASYFLLSRVLGASFRLYLVALVLQKFVLKDWGIPFEVTVLLSIALIWVYTHKGGIKTIIWTDTLQTLFMLLAVGFTVVLVTKHFGWNVADLPAKIGNSEYGTMWQFSDWQAKDYFWKQFIGGALIALTMTGMDQDMMQKNLSCTNIKDAQKNMLSFAFVLVFVNLVFLALGALLYMYVGATGFEFSGKGDELYAAIALSGNLGVLVTVLFILGLIAAAYSSADSALTSLTTSFCIDMLETEKMEEKQEVKTRKRVHIGMSLLLFIVICVFNQLNNKSIIDQVLTVAGYTYGPILGMFAFGILSKKQVTDKFIPLVTIVAPIICFIIQTNSESWFGGYKFGYELLGLNGALTFAGLYLLSFKRTTS
jgi:SSS family solute:Na+ symporter